MSRSSENASRISPTEAKRFISEHGSPLYLYDTAELTQRADTLSGLQAPYGLTIRYAFKANPHPSIVELFSQKGIQFDASSSYEAAQLLELGISGSAISLSSQQPAHNLAVLLENNVQFVATSLHQLELFAGAEHHPSTVGLRVNPGLGLGHIKRFTTGGPAASFGLWHEYVPRALELAQTHGIVIDRLHVHVGTGGDPSKWGDILDAGLEVAAQMPDVTSLDVGGGFKIAYTDEDTAANVPEIMEIFSEKLTAFAKRTDRKLRLEIEPGRWLVATSGYLLTKIVDIVDTGSEGYTFLRTDTGMNDFLRPAMYGAQHNMQIANDANERAEYVIVGHNCETSDVLTPAPHDPESILPRRLSKTSIGDILVVRDVGAYCASMSTKGYNAYPSAKEVMI